MKNIDRIKVGGVGGGKASSFVVLKALLLASETIFFSKRNAN